MPKPLQKPKRPKQPKISEKSPELQPRMEILSKSFVFLVFFVFPRGIASPNPALDSALVLQTQPWSSKSMPGAPKPALELQIQPSTSNSHPGAPNQAFGPHIRPWCSKPNPGASNPFPEHQSKPNHCITKKILLQQCNNIAHTNQR